MTSYRNMSHNKHCSSCGARRTKPTLAYDPKTMKSYCRDSEACHPSGAELIPADQPQELVDRIQEVHPRDVSIALFKLVGKSAAFRPTPEQSAFLIKWAQETNTESLNATILNMIDYLMANSNVDKKDLTHCGWDMYTARTFQHDKPKEEPGRRGQRFSEEIAETVIRRASQKREQEKKESTEEVAEEIVPVTKEVKEEPQPKPEPKPEQKPEQTEKEADDEWELEI